MNISRREFLRGSTALIAATIISPYVINSLPRTPYIVFENVPLEEFGNIIPNLGYSIGRIIGNQLYPTFKTYTGPTLVDI